MVWVIHPDQAVNWGSEMSINNRLEKQGSFIRLSTLLLPPLLMTVLLMTGCAFETDRPYAYLPDAQTENAGVYIEQCGACHSAPHPKRLSAAAWKDMVVVMDKRRKERGYPPLAGAERKKVMTYLDTHAR